MCRVAVRGEDGDLVAEVLEADGSVDDETLSTADAQVGVDEDDASLALEARHAHRAECGQAVMASSWRSICGQAVRMSELIRVILGSRVATIRVFARDA